MVETHDWLISVVVIVAIVLAAVAGAIAVAGMFT